MPEETPRPRSPKDYADREHFWCPGCGDAGDLTAIMRWCARHNIDPSQLVDSTGIGCSSKISEYHKCNGHHWLHGRSLPIAVAVKIVNPRLIVMDAGGDGDGGAIGMEHFIHTCRRNPNIVYLVMNNQVYGLTKGQLSPTGHKGLVTPTSPAGAKDQPVDMAELAIASGATFVARGYSFNQDQLAMLFDRAFEHVGFSYVDTLSPCPTYHREPTHESAKDWYEENILDVIEADRSMRASLTPVEIIDPNYDPTDRARALAVLSHAKQIQWEMQDLRGRSVAMVGKIPTGILYVREGGPTFEENLGVSPDMPIVDLNLSVEANRVKLEELIAAFR